MPENFASPEDNLDALEAVIGNATAERVYAAEARDGKPLSIEDRVACLAGPTDRKNLTPAQLAELSLTCGDESTMQQAASRSRLAKAVQKVAGGKTWASMSPAERETAKVAATRSPFDRLADACAFYAGKVFGSLGVANDFHAANTAATPAPAVRASTPAIVNGPAPKPVAGIPAGKQRWIAKAEFMKCSGTQMSALSREGVLMTEDAARVNFTLPPAPAPITCAQYNALTPAAQKAHCEAGGRVYGLDRDLPSPPPVPAPAASAPANFARAAAWGTLTTKKTK